MSGPRHRVRQARERAGLTEGQVRKHRPDLYALEAQDELPEPDIALALAAFGVSRCWLLGHTGQRMGDVALTLLEADITDHDRHKVMEFVLSIGSCADCLGENPGVPGPKNDNPADY